MIVLACGSRNWCNRPVVAAVLSEYAGRATILYHGRCRGADKQAGEVAASLLGWEVRARPAAWTTHGVAAGPLRNSGMLAEMLAEPPPHLGIAFHDDPAASLGTKDMVAKMLAAGVPVRLVADDGSSRWVKL